MSEKLNEISFEEFSTISNSRSGKWNNELIESDAMEWYKKYNYKIVEYMGLNVSDLYKRYNGTKTENTTRDRQVISYGTRKKIQETLERLGLYMASRRIVRGSEEFFYVQFKVEAKEEEVEDTEDTTEEE